MLAATWVPLGAVDPQREASTVILDDMGVRNLRLETAELEERVFEETIFALGRLEVLPGQKAVVSSRIAGRAYSVLALPDMRCEQGDELVWVESRQPGDPPPTVRLDAPIAGLISEVKIAVGQPVEPGDTLVEIVNLSTIEADAAVPEHLVGKVQKGTKARMRVAAVPDEVFEVEVAHLGASADPASGTLEAAFHVPNEDEKLRPGMRAEFSIITSSRENVPCVPKAAVLGDGASRFVFVKDFDLENAFIKTPVEVGQSNDEFTEIVSGLLPGDEVVTRGAYSLSFAGGGSVSLKEALDAAHGHEHNEDGSEMTAEQKAAHEAEKAGAGGDGYAHGAGGSALLWQIISGVLAALLVISQVTRPRRPEAGDEDTAATQKKEVA